MRSRLREVILCQSCSHSNYNALGRRNGSISKKLKLQGHETTLKPHGDIMVISW